VTTFAELRSTLARRLADPSNITFSDDDLKDMVNEAIAEVSRIAPQPFVEDLQVLTGRTRYKLRGGNANLVPNYSFEEGDDTVLATAPVTVTAADAPDLLGGWNLVADTPLYFPKNANRITGLRVAFLQPTAGQVDATLYADIPVNPSTTYQVEGWQWKLLAGGLVNRLELETRDVDNNLIESVWTHDTTSAQPVLASTSYTTADDGTEFYLRIKLIAKGTQPSTRQSFGFEDISVAEASQAVLVAPNAINSIEVSKVELWNVTDGVPYPVMSIQRPGFSRSDFTEVGWRIWGGVLELPYGLVQSLDTSAFIKVWGYAPYDTLVDDTQVTDLSNELEWAVLLYCDLIGTRRLWNDRALFSQWQTRSNNTDVTPAALAGRLNGLEQAWLRKERQLHVLRA